MEEAIVIKNSFLNFYDILSNLIQKFEVERDLGLRYS